MLCFTGFEKPVWLHIFQSAERASAALDERESVRHYYYYYYLTAIQPRRHRTARRSRNTPVTTTMAWTRGFSVFYLSRSSFRFLYAQVRGRPPKPSENAQLDDHRRSSGGFRVCRGVPSLGPLHDCVRNRTASERHRVSGKTPRAKS